MSENKDVVYAFDFVDPELAVLSSVADESSCVTCANVDV